MQRNVRIAAQMLVLAVTRKKENEHYPPRANLETFSNFQPQSSTVCRGVNQWRTLDILDNNQTLYLPFFKALKIITHTTLHHPVP